MNTENTTATPAALPQPGDLVDEREAAAILGIAVGTLRNWRAQRPRVGPPIRKIGQRAVRYLRTDLAAFINAGAGGAR